MKQERFAPNIIREISNPISFSKEQKTHKFKHLRSAIAGITLSCLSADSWYGHEYYDTAKFASELRQSSAVMQYYAHGKEAARNEELEDLVVFANEKNITNMLCIRNDTTGSTLYINPILRLIQQGKTISMIHTHPVNTNDFVYSLFYYQKNLSAKYYNSEFMKVLDVQYIRQQAELGKLDYYSIPPSSTDIVTHFAINYVEKNSNVTSDKSYVFDSSGVWSYTTDSDNSFWWQLEKQFNHQIPQNNSQFDSLLNKINKSNIVFFNDYQVEMLRLFTRDIGFGRVPKHGAVRDVIHKAREYGVILEYAPYKVIENSPATSSQTISR